MSDKSYSSVQYYAQTFRDYLANAFKLGYTFKPRQKGDNVYFELMRRGVSVRFSMEGESPVVSLEVQVSDEKWISSENRKLKIRRSKTGRVLGKTYKRLYTGFILPFFRSVYLESPDNE